MPDIGGSAMPYSLVSILMRRACAWDPRPLAVDRTRIERPVFVRIEPLRIRTVQLPIVAVIISQVVMVHVMVMTPIHIARIQRRRPRGSPAG